MQLIEDLLLLPQAVSRGSAGCWLLAAICCCCGNRWISSGDHRWEGSSTSQDGVPQAGTSHAPADLLIWDLAAKMLRSMI
jgi:hypothetical protein